MIKIQDLRIITPATPAELVGVEAFIDRQLNPWSAAWKFRDVVLPAPRPAVRGYCRAVEELVALYAFAGWSSQVLDSDDQRGLTVRFWPSVLPAPAQP